jgi:fatty acid/phospholipid biosynthesis enzyme
LIRVAVDAMGGDRAPDEVIAGALEAASSRIEPLLVGPRGLDTGGLELVEAPTTIAMDEKPGAAVRAKRDSSLVTACRLVREGGDLGRQHRRDGCRGARRDPPSPRRQQAGDRRRDP